MKKILVLAILIIAAMSFAAFAEEGKQEETQTITKSADTSENVMLAQMGSVCYAHTACPGGGNIWCRTWSGSGGGCTWNTIPGYSVSCTGHNAFGAWEYIYFTCN